MSKNSASRTPGGIIAISDVHGNLPYLRGLLAKLSLREEDTLIFCGDFLEKGRYSLETLRYILRLSQLRRVHAVLGNCDFWQDAIYRPTPGSDEYCKRYLLSDSAGWGPGLLAQMCQEAGFASWAAARTWANSAACSARPSSRSSVSSKACPTS